MISPDHPLVLRTYTAVLLGVPLLVCLLLGGLWLLAAATLVAGVTAYEWQKLVDESKSRWRWFFTFVCLAAPLTAFLGGPLMALWMVAIAAVWMSYRQAFSKEAVLSWGWGAAIAGLAPAAFVLLRQHPGGGVVLCLWVVTAVVATDTGAYFTGRRFGGRQLSPHTSPQKTWSGAIGGGIAGSLLGVSVVVISGLDGILAFFIASLMLSAVAQFGDFAVSVAKRRAGVKDTGQILPGHGGALDRVDSLTAAVLAAYLAVASGLLVSW